MTSDIRNLRPGCLITGVGGFLGSYLAEFLVDQGLSVYGIVREDSQDLADIRDKLSLYTCDVLDKGRLEALVQQISPDVVFHLAAQSVPVVSWREPEATFEVNVFGTLNLLEAVRQASPSATVLVAGSSVEYGYVSPEEVPIKEDRALTPASPYGVSKVAAGMLAKLYAEAHGLKVVRTRPFIVIGPGKVADVMSDFSKGIAAIERGRRASLKVGNLEAVRDFLDVEDATRALWLLAERGVPGEVYNICSGVGYSIQQVLDRLISMADAPVSVESDPARMRPADEPVLIGDNSRLKALGWEPEVPIDRSLGNILDAWRAKS